MPWREKFVLHVGSAYFAGISLPDWLALVYQNEFAVAPSCLVRAGFISMVSVPNTILCAIEDARYRSRWEAGEISSPLFILGHYRSGTTHLQNLLTVDPRFAFLNAYQASYPDTFLLTEDFSAKQLKSFVPKTRPFDNVVAGFDVPSEDDIALTNATRISPYTSTIFPRRAAHYDRFLTMKQATPDEISRWKAGLMTLLQKLTLKYERPLVLKSPPHTARIKLLLELFPNAKFVHIHRDPYVVIQSTVNMMHLALDWIRLQSAAHVDWTDRSLNQWREMHDAFFEQKLLIPPTQFHELAFTDLERDPIAALRKIYEELQLPTFDEVETKMRGYLDSLASYKKNKFPKVSDELKARIGETCRRGFEEWGYER
jgi:omega-hydroxy-beta-dihydromenaquinone-9 sulfotransferase